MLATGEQASNDEATFEGLQATDNPDWGDGFRSHVEALIQKLEDAAEDYGMGLFAMLRGGFNVEFYGGKGFSVSFDGDGLPHVERTPLDGRPDPGLWIKTEMWAFDALLDPTTDIENDDPESFFVMAGWESEGDLTLLNRLGKIGAIDGGNQNNGTNARIGLMMGK